MTLLGTAACLAFAAAAWAHWTAGPGTGLATAATGTLVAPDGVQATPGNTVVALTWSAAHLTTGEAATGYYVRRVRDSDGAEAAACGTSVSSTIAALSCNDTINFANGDYHYVVVASRATWTATSTPGPTVTVNAKPTVGVNSLTPAANTGGWNKNSPVTVKLVASSPRGIRAITYSIDSGPSTVGPVGGTVSFPVSGDGTHSVTFTATDNTGASSDPQSTTVKIDTVPPAAPSAPALTAASDSGSSSTDRITNVVRPTFVGTAEPNVIVFVQDGSTSLGVTVSDSAGNWSVASTVSLTNGQHVITTNAQDLADNVGPGSAGTTITIDTVAPSTPPAPTLSPASDSGASNSDRITNVSTPVFTGTAEPGSVVTLYTGAVVRGSGTASEAGDWSITSSALAGGVSFFTVKATDVAGNTSSAPPSVSVTTDYTPPNKPSVSLAAASDTGRSSTDRITASTTPTLTGFTEAQSTVRVFDTDGTTVLATATTSTTTYSTATTALADGAHSVSAQATDLAGNVGGVGTAITITIDTVAPAAPSNPALASGYDTGRSTSDNVTNRSTPVFAGTNENRAIVTLREGSTTLGTVTTAATTYSVASSALTDGTHTVSVFATDVAGNTGPDSGTTTITVDTVAPDTPTTAPILDTASDTGISNSDGITKNTTLNFHGTADAASYIGLYNGTTATGSSVPATGGTYAATTGAIGNGTYPITVKASDLAGNLSGASPAFTLVVDNLAPSVTVEQASVQADPTSDPTVRFTVTFSETVYGFETGDVTLAGTAGATTATVTGSGSVYEIRVTGMTRAGTVIARLTNNRCMDAAGNINIDSTSTDNTVTYAP